MTRDGKTHPKCPDCGIIWRQSGDRTGHCSECHYTFTSLTAFDRHRVDTEAGRICRDPGDMAHTSPDGTRQPIFDLVIGHGEHDWGIAYWALHTTDEQRATFAALNEQRKATR